jgi:hypothetical protein
VSKEDIKGSLMREGRVVSYESKKLNVHEHKYMTGDLELLSLVHALKAWIHYIIDKKIQLWINNEKLKYF